MNLHQNAAQNVHVKVGNESFGRVEQFRYLGTTQINENSTYGEIESTEVEEC